MNSKGGPLWKKYFIEGPERHTDILCGGHKNQYQFKNAINIGGTVFCLYVYHQSDIYQGTVFSQNLYY